MKILLVAINAKYIHSNPAIYSLRAYAGEKEGREIQTAEYTINHRSEIILADIYRRRPELIAISCYIWNWSMVCTVLPELSKILPGVFIWLGGPEVSYNPEEVLEKYPMVTGIMVGEGEETFKELADGKEWKDIEGIVYRNKDGTGKAVRRTRERKALDLSAVPFLYNDVNAKEQFANRIIYYESSRGCPYRCSYCLSSIDKKVRLRDISIVKRELAFFLDHRVRQVKFVDRTFNCVHEHAMAVWEYLLENDNNVTNFHFEIAADLLTEEELSLLEKMRPGLIQMEIGVQTLNPQTLREIRRGADMGRLKKAVQRLHEAHNIHIHLDLIAGLPYEDYSSFQKSFDTVYEMKPEQLQLGFLKVLKGSYLCERVAAYGMQYLDIPPYEVLYTKWLSYEELLRLKEIEEMVEIYYNSGQFTSTMGLLLQIFPSPFALYNALAEFYREKGYFQQTPGRVCKYQVLEDFAMTTALKEKRELVREMLTFDFYLRENAKSRPDFAPVIASDELPLYKAGLRAFYEREEQERTYLPDYDGYDSRQLAKMTHVEVFHYSVWLENVTIRELFMAEAEETGWQAVLFDYRHRDALTYAARYIVLGHCLYSNNNAAM